MIWLLVRVIDAGKALELALVGQLIQPFHIALAADFDGTFDIDFHEIPNMVTRPCPRLKVRRDGGRDTDHVIACEQSAHKGDTLDIGIAILFAETQSFAQMST